MPPVKPQEAYEFQDLTPGDEDWYQTYDSSDPRVQGPDLGARSQMPDLLHQALFGDISFSAGLDPMDQYNELLNDALGGFQSFSMTFQDSDDFFNFENEDFIHDSTVNEFGESCDGISPQNNGSWFPYPNKESLLIDIVFNSPRMRFSASQQAVVLQLLKDCGARNTPSFYALQKLKDKLLQRTGNPTVKVSVPSGHIFHMNSVVALLAKDYANPKLRRAMQMYPEDTDGPAQEAWHGSKWLTSVDPDMLTPMFIHNGLHFYINELALCTDSEWFIPQCIYQRTRGHSTKLCVLGHQVLLSTTGWRVSPDPSSRCTESFITPYPDLSGAQQSWEMWQNHASDYHTRMPNPLRKLAKGCPVECPPIAIFVDNMSGNISKQWSVHYSMYMSLASLPRRLLDKQQNIHFVAMSPHASPMELLYGMSETLKTNRENPTIAWDSITRKEVVIIPWLLFLPGDNPMQSECASHIGLLGNFYCRCCHVGGTDNEKMEGATFCSLFEPGILRNPVETHAIVLKQLQVSAEYGGATRLKQLITGTGVKDTLAYAVMQRTIAIGKDLRLGRGRDTDSQIEESLRATFETDDITKLINPLLTLEGFNVHQDTPVETLHTFLLGVVKYFWAQTIHNLTESQTILFRARLHSVSVRGLNIPHIMADYMIQYSGGLLGKHFKTLVQIMSFTTYDLVPDELYYAWQLLGHLAVQLWETDIVNIHTYTDNLRSLISDFMDIVAKRAPGIILAKPKFHILTHLPDHIICFGPSLLFSTERYESFNHIFQLCSIYSNRQAPSRDIAITFAGFERGRHILLGGRWWDADERNYVGASPTVLDYIENSRHYQYILGVSTPESEVTRRVEYDVEVRTSQRKRHENQPKTRTWSSSQVSDLIRPTEERRSLEDDRCLFILKSFAALNGDKVHVGDHIIIHKRLENSLSYQPTFAVVNEISADSRNATLALIYIAVTVLQVSPQLHEKYGMPVLRSSGIGCLVNIQEVQCVVNTQHDCYHAQCAADGEVITVEERELTKRTRAVVRHCDLDEWIINTHSLHNAKTIRAALPTHLIKRNTHSAEEKQQIRLEAVGSLQRQKADRRREKEVRKEVGICMSGNGEEREILGPTNHPNTQLHVPGPCGRKRKKL